MVKIIFFFAVLFFFSGIFFGLDFTDSFYHLNQALYPADNVYLYPFIGSSLLVKILVDFVGPEILPLRIINSVLLVISFFIPFLSIKINRSKWEIIFFIACGILLYIPFNANILGYDTLSIFFLTLIFTFCISYFSKPAYYKLILLSLFCSVAVLVRLPNILVLPIISLLLLKIDSRSLKYSGWISTYFVVIASVGILFGYAAYYENWNEFYLATANSESHFIKELLYRYFKDAIYLLIYSGLIIGAYVLFKKNQQRFNEMTLSLAIIIFVGLLSFFLLPTKYSFNYSVFIFALALNYTGIQLYHWKRNSPLQNRILILFFLFLFINPFGSSTGLLKGYSLFLLFPFVISISKADFDEFWSALLLILIPFSLLNKSFGIYQDKNLIFLNENPKHGLLHSIYTSEERGQYINYVSEQVENLNSKNIDIYFYGDKSHIFQYLYPENKLGISSFIQPVNELSFISEIEEVMKTEDEFAIFLIGSYPELEIKDLTLMEKELLVKGFKKSGGDAVDLFLWKKEFD